jgi:ribonucleotide monophosphatase NagD (HAD superfamily)
MSGLRTEREDETGGGAMVGAIKGSTKKEPLVLGKPSTFMIDCLASEYDLFSYFPHLWLHVSFLILHTAL